MMADINAVKDENHSPHQDDMHQTGNGAGDNRVPKRSRMSADDDDDDDDKPGRERRKIEIKFIQDKSRRHITFSKRKAGIMKKVRRVFYSPLIPSSTVRVTVAGIQSSTLGSNASARIVLTTCVAATQAYELSVLTGTQVLLLVVSETGLVYTFTTPKLQPLVTKSEGKNLIQVSTALTRWRAIRAHSIW